MRRAPLSRLASFVLALLMLGGGGSLPLLDALLDHAGGGAGAPAVHYCSTDGTPSHAERCTLGVPLPVAIPDARRPERIVTSLPVVPAAAKLISAPAGARPHSPDRSRAPPTLSV